MVIFTLDTVTNASLVHNDRMIHNAFIYTTHLRIFFYQHFLHVTITRGKSTQLLMVIHKLRNPLVPFGKFLTQLIL